MRRILAAAAFLIGLLPNLAAAQGACNSPLAANTVCGRLGVGAGPVQAIPFSALGPNLITNFLAVSSPLSISGLNLSITGSAGGVLAGASPAFTATPTLGVASTTTGSLSLANAGNSGVVTLTSPSTATSWTCKLPTTQGLSGQALITDGASPCQLSWSAGAGTVNSGLAGQLAFYAGNSAAVSGTSVFTINNSTGLLTVGTATSIQGSIALSGSVTGTTTLAAPTTGTGTMTLQAGTDTLVGRATTDTLTNKTLTSPTINSATMTTPTLGVATATTVNKVTITAPATGSTLTIADGKTLTDTSGVGASVLLGATGGGFSAYAGASCTNQFIRSLSAAAAATCASVANTDLTNSSVTIGSTNVALGATAATVAGLTLTAPTLNGGTLNALTTLGIRSTGSGAFDLIFANTENLTAARTLTLTLENANRTIDLSGNLTLAAAFSTSGAFPITLTATGTTNVTLPTSGTLAVQNAANTFSSTNTFSAVQQFTDIKFSSGKLYPTVDSTTAMQFCKADGTTCYGTLDTSNQAATWATLKFTTLDPTSLASSTTTITGLTANNSPTAANDYALYYSAADGKIRKITLSALTSASVAGVSSLNGLTGGLSVATSGQANVAASGTTVTVAVPDTYSVQNCTLAASVGSNLLTVAVKDNAGADPSATSPCRIPFRSSTAGTGSWTIDSVTTALSISTNSTGATLGSSNSTAFRFWVVAFDNSGTPVLGLYNASGANACTTIDESVVQSSTAISGSATSAATYYTPNGTTVTSKAIRILGYVEYNATGLATAGTYASAPNFVQTFGPGVHRPCERWFANQVTTSSSTTSTSSTFADTNLTMTVTPKSAANHIACMASGLGQSAASTASVQSTITRTSTNIGSLAGFLGASGGLASMVNFAPFDSPNTTSGTTYKVQVKNSDNSTTVTYAVGSASYLACDEIQG